MSVSNRRPNEFLFDLVAFRFDHAQVTGDTTGTPEFVAEPRAMRVLKVLYYNATGLAADNDNFFEVSVRNGSTKIAAWNTDGNGTTTGINGGATEGAIPAGEWVELTLAEDTADRVLALGDSLHYVLDETGTATLPAGKFQVVVEYV